MRYCFESGCLYNFQGTCDGGSKDCMCDASRLSETAKQAAARLCREALEAEQN